jgi:hypothetical protein
MVGTVSRRGFLSFCLILAENTLEDAETSKSGLAVLDKDIYNGGRFEDMETPG